MSQKITCPVCQRSDIEENICPNCEADISLMRTLVELPKASSFSSKITLNYWLVVLTIVFLILGIILGVLGTYSLARQNKVESNVMTDLSPSPSSKPITQQRESSSSKSCVDGFYYTVREGDSLSAISKRFYGSSQNLSMILKINSQLLTRENNLKIGETILVPNQEKNC